MAARPGKGENRRSRLERFTAEDNAGRARPELELPPIGFGGHLVEMLFEVGPSTAGEAVTFQEIAAWSAQTGVALDAWESQMLRVLSGAYLNEHQLASDEKRPPPHVEAPRKTREQVASTILAVFKRLAEQDAKQGVALRER